MADPYISIITLSGLVILSYLFNLISKRVSIPSVVLLIGVGVLSRWLFDHVLFIRLPDTSFVLEILGIIGLILIVLEGALDLELKKEKRAVIGKSFLSALLILVATSLLVALIISYFWKVPFERAYVFAVPFAVISSAIAIPSVKNFSKAKREFIVYESTFSDILGIMLFNYLVLENVAGFEHLYVFLKDILIITVVSIVATLVMLSILNYSTLGVKFFLIYAILFLLYSVAKIFHLPSLIMVMFFGLAINNVQLYNRGFFAKHIKLEKVKRMTDELRFFTEELAFLIRTFFFVLFGYSLNLALMIDLNVVYAGTAIVGVIIIVRYIFLKFISHVNVFPEIFIAPRGLITILLYYSIPASLSGNIISDGLLAFVILLSSLVMMMAIMISGSRYRDEPDLII